MVPGCVQASIATEIENVLLFEPADSLRHDLFVERAKWRLGFIGYDVLGIGPFAVSNGGLTFTVTVIDRRDNSESEAVVKVEGKKFDIV